MSYKHGNNKPNGTLRIAAAHSSCSCCSCDLNNKAKLIYTCFFGWLVFLVIISRDSEFHILRQPELSWSSNEHLLVFIVHSADLASASMGRAWVFLSRLKWKWMRECCSFKQTQVDLLAVWNTIQLNSGQTHAVRRMHPMRIWEIIVLQVGLPDLCWKGVLACLLAVFIIWAAGLMRPQDPKSGKI